MTTKYPLDRFLDAQMEAWGRQDLKKKSPRVGPVVAVTREPGCDGESIAQTLADELGLVLYDWEIVKQIAKDAQVSEQVVATLDEKHRSELEEWLTDFAGGVGLSEYQYLQSLRKVLFTVAAHGNAIIVGRAANFLLPPEKKTLGLCLVAPLDVRVKNIMQKLHVSQEDARKNIASTEREHRLLIKEIGRADIGDATNYHIVINTALITPKTIVQIVKEILKAKS